MNLSVEQIFYTSFSNIGFTILSSSLISSEHQQFFVKNIVERYWNSYNPPEPRYRAAYLQQKSLEETFFGWLYNDESDDFGRTNIPYFICYLVFGKLTFSQLDIIWNCLKSGPILDINRNAPTYDIESLTIPKHCDYESDRLGVEIPKKIEKQTEQALKRRKLISQYIPKDLNFKLANEPAFNYQYPDQTLTVLPPSSDVNQGILMNPLTIETILHDLLMKPLDIQGLALVSQEGKSIITPMGMDEETTSILSGTMLYVAQTTQDELDWQEIETIALKSQQGHLILAYCTPDSYLLIKTGKVLTGLLEAEIGRTVKKLQTQLETSEVSLLESVSSPLLMNNLSSTEENLGKTDNQQEVSNPDSLVQKILTPTSELLTPNSRLDKRLLEMGQELINLYPDFVATVRDMDNNPDINDQQMLALGEYVGERLVKQGKIKAVSAKNMVSALNKLVVPAISYFMIADSQNNELNVHANPFCLYKTSDRPSCYFLRGMIQGLLSSIPNLPRLTVEEISCKATGADSCKFTVR